MTAIGLIEGIAESTASLLKVVFGWLSDRPKRRKPFVVAGYAFSAFSKPLLALASAWPLVLVSRVIDRIGKGIRTSPRDAMIAASCAPEAAARRSGCIARWTRPARCSALLALLLLRSMGYRAIFLLAFVPAALGVIALVFLRGAPRPRRNRLPAVKRGSHPS